MWAFQDALRKRKVVHRVLNYWPQRTLGPLLSALLAVIVSASPTLAAAQTSSQQLNSRIGSPVRARYAAVRDAKDWLNPYLQVCADGVDITVQSLKRNSMVTTRNLRATLVKLPVEDWPYGRIVALQECSIGPPENAETRRQRLTEVEAVLKALGLHVSRWPA
jgi:hypothetical protein